MKRCQVCARLLNVPERMNRFMLIHILMCLYPQSHSRESDPYLNQRYYVIILLSCENFECLSRLPIPHTVVPCLIMTCQYPWQILPPERFCQSWRDMTAQEDHVQRQEQARGSSQAEFCHYPGGCEKHYEGHAPQIWPLIVESPSSAFALPSCFVCDGMYLSSAADFTHCVLHSCADLECLLSTIDNWPSPLDIMFFSCPSWQDTMGGSCILRTEADS